MSISCGKRGTFATSWGLKRRFAWQVRDIGHFFIGVAGMALSDVGRRWSKWRRFWMSFFVAGAVFAELWWRFETQCSFSCWQNVCACLCSVLWKSNMCSRNLLVTLSMLDRSRCGHVLILVASLTSWQRDLMSSVEGPSTAILNEFHGAK